jgi:Uma2 family endonuclease
MAFRERVSTVADLRAIENLPENKDKRFELLNGVIYEVPYPTPTHNSLIGNAYSPLRDFVKVNKLGYVFTDTVSYSLANGDEFAPDVSFVSRQRQTPPVPKQFTIAPDMAVEIVSPGNREREMMNKTESLLKSGTHFVWIIYPASKVVDICHLSADGSVNTRKVSLDGVLDGEDALPGFTLAVKDIFDLYSE